MRRLFAEEFLVPVLDPERPKPELRYDEERQLNVMPDGRPFVEPGRAGSTDTLTEVRSEADDYDPPPGDEALATLGTLTKVQTERDDFAADTLGLATETRMPGERDDFAPEVFLGTYTAGGGEPDDDDIQARAGGDYLDAPYAGTKTGARGEADDFYAGTKTGARGEADDFWSEDDVDAATPQL
jgi:putative ATP-grasp target RiPP